MLQNPLICNLFSTNVLKIHTELPERMQNALRPKCGCRTGEQHLQTTIYYLKAVILIFLKICICLRCACS